MREGIEELLNAGVITAIDTQFNESKAAIRRYQEGYRAADALVN